MRKFIGKVGGVNCFEDSLCPKDNAYLVPEGELLVPIGTPINKMIIDFVRKYKKHIGKFKLDSLKVKETTHNSEEGDKNE